MKIDYLSESIKYDAAANELGEIATTLRNKRNRQADEFRREGKEPPQFYDILIDDVLQLRDKYLDQSSVFFQRYKQLERDFDENAVNGLLCAISVQWAHDYEDALCSKDYNREERIKTLKDEARYVVTDRIVRRIDDARKKFVAIARTHFDEILEDTKQERERVIATKRSADYLRPTMRNRCPCCGGGLYAKKIDKNTYQVRCPTCSLFETIRVVS